MKVTAGMPTSNGARRSVKGFSRNISELIVKTSRVSFQ